MELKLEGDVEELEKLAKKKELETEEEKDEFDRQVQNLLIQIGQQQEAIRLLAIEDFRRRIIKAQEEYHMKHEQERKHFSMDEIKKYFDEKRSSPSEEKTEEKNEKNEEHERT